MEKCIVSKVKEGIHKELKYYAREAGGWKTMLPSRCSKTAAQAAQVKVGYA